MSVMNIVCVAGQGVKEINPPDALYTGVIKTTKNNSPDYRIIETQKGIDPIVSLGRTAMNLDEEAGASLKLEMKCGTATRTAVGEAWTIPLIVSGEYAVRNGGLTSREVGGLIELPSEPEAELTPAEKRKRTIAAKKEAKAK